jgi:hypothetical protein
MPQPRRNRSAGRGLPKRFEPYAQQAQTESEIRYGAQETGLENLFGSRTRDYQRQAAAQETGFRSLLGSLQTGGVRLNQTYNDAGLTPEIRAQYANTPDGQRILAQLARDQGAIQQQQMGAESGQQFIQARMADDYREDVGEINQSLLGLLKERGLFEQQALSGLIGEDRSRRSTNNAAARQQQFDAEEAVRNRQATQDNALIGQGLLPGPDGSLQPLPGGKADPNAPGNKPKRTTGPGTATRESQQAAGNDFSKAVGLARGMLRPKPGKPDPGRTPEVRETIAGTLTNGKKGSAGKVIYETVPVLDARGQPTGRTKRQAKLDPATGEQITSRARPDVPSFDGPIAEAATEQAMFGYVTTETVRELQQLGYSVNQIPGLKTEGQHRKSQPRQKRPVSRPRNAPSGTPGQSRPT